jgi:hypothetical protein
MAQQVGLRDTAAKTQARRAVDSAVTTRSRSEVRSTVVRHRAGRVTRLASSIGPSVR